MIFSYTVLFYVIMRKFDSDTAMMQYVL